MRTGFGESPFDILTFRAVANAVSDVMEIGCLARIAWTRVAREGMQSVAAAIELCVSISLCASLTRTLQVTHPAPVSIFAGLA